MTTQRKQTKVVEREGVDHVQAIVHGANCTFTETETEDMGTDAYIEFVQDEAATGSCIAVQIKSGASFVSQDGNTYYLRADKKHFEYWASHILPVAGIVYNPGTKKAAWCDIKQYLQVHPEVMEAGPYSLPIPADSAFTAATFGSFFDHFASQADALKSDINFGKALRWFADQNDEPTCIDGLKSLFYYHRNRAGTWYYLSAALPHVRSEFVRRHLTIALSYVPGHSDIFWTEENIIATETRRNASSVLSYMLGRREIETLLGVIDENGLGRGSIGECVHAVIDVAPNRVSILEDIAFDSSLSEDVRYYALGLLVHELQDDNKDRAMQLLEHYVALFPSGTNTPLVVEVLDMLCSLGYVSIY